MPREWTQNDIDAHERHANDGWCDGCDEPVEQCECSVLMQCGMTTSGQCTSAGSEFCDFECPIGRRK